MSSSNSCHSLTWEEKDAVFYTRTAAASVSFAACLLAFSVLCVYVCCLRVWKTFVHRLKLYLTAVALVLSVLYLLQVLPMKLGDPGREPGVWREGRWGDGVCEVIGFALTYTDWVMLLLICWLVVYLLRLARCIEKPVTAHHQMLFEVAGVSVTFALPLLFVWAPFVTNSYGVGSNMMWCGIVIERDSNCNSSSTRQGFEYLLGLWYIPTAVVTLLCTVGVIIVISLFWKYYKKRGLTRQMTSAIVKGIPPTTYLVLYNTINFVDIASLIYHSSTKGNWSRSVDYRLWLTHAVTGPGRALIVPFAFVLSQAFIRCCFKGTREAPNSYHRLQ